MLPIFALIAAMLGLLLVVFLIYREVGTQIGGTEKGVLGAAVALVVLVAIWQVIEQMPGPGGGH